MNQFTDLSHICSVREMVVVVFIAFLCVTFLLDLTLIQSLSTGPSQSFLYVLLHKHAGMNL